jgi:serine/threonine protein kinase
VEVLRFPGLLSPDSSGRTLEAWLEEPRPLEQRLAVFRGVAQGVAALHARALPHGDLNPESVWIEPTGHARVCLPGVMATVLSLLREGESVTTSGAALGAPQYLSPEQARRPEVGDLRSDRFSLGCLLYLLLAGRGPFDGLDRYECWDAARSGRIPPLEGVDPDLAEIALALLSPDPNARPSLDVVLSRLPDVPAPPLPEGSEPDRSSRVVPLAVGGGALVLAVLAAAAWWLW